MKIKAKCRYDYECVKAATHVNTFKKFNPKKVSLFMFILLLIDVVLLAMDIFVFTDNSSSKTVIALISCIMCMVFLYIFYFQMPKNQYRALGKLKNLENKYFFEDDQIIIIGEHDEYKGRTEIPYSMIIKAVETSRYLLLYRTKLQSYIVDKSTFMNGTIDDIRAKLVPQLKTKYIICRY